MTSKKPPKPSAAELKAMRIALLEDEATKGIAQELELTLEEYVDKVLHYVQNPELDPEVYVADDEDLRALGFEPPDLEAIAKRIAADAKVSAATQSNQFDGHKKPLVKMSDLEPSEPHEKNDELLQAEVQARKARKP